MVFEVYQGRQCTKVVQTMEVEINKGLDVEIRLTEENKAKDRVITSLSQEKAFAQAESKEWHGRYDNQVKMTKHQKNQKNKWKVGTVIAVTFMVLREVFSPD